MPARCLAVLASFAILVVAGLFHPTELPQAIARPNSEAAFKAEGGALFIVRFPVAATSVVQADAARA